MILTVKNKPRFTYTAEQFVIHTRNFSDSQNPRIIIENGFKSRVGFNGACRVFTNDILHVKSAYLLWNCVAKWFTVLILTAAAAAAAASAAASASFVATSSLEAIRDSQWPRRLWWPLHFLHVLLILKQLFISHYWA